MKAWVSAAALALLVLSGARPALATDDATLCRLFLRDGTSLVSYGEFSRVGDRVVFSMPTAAMPNPPLQLVTIPADRVNWDRTDRYAESARANHYFLTQAESDYADLSSVLTTALNQVVTVTDAAGRLSIVEGARRALAEWSQTHYHYRQKDVQQMLSMLDEAIADLRVSAGGPQFNLSLVAMTEMPVPTEPLLAPPTARETIEQVLSAARLTGSGAERQALLDVALVAIDRDRAQLPPRWAIATRATTMTAAADERRLDRAYQSMASRLIALSEARARAADVRGVLRVVDTIRATMSHLGASGPRSWPERLRPSPRISTPRAGFASSVMPGCFVRGCCTSTRPRSTRRSGFWAASKSP